MSVIWPQILPELAERIANFLDTNEIACSLRLVNKAAATQFRGPQYTTVRLSQPVPHHALAWHCHRSNVLRGLSLRKREQLLCLTARSGSLLNLGTVATTVDCPFTAKVFDAAVASGHLDVCQWLRERGCPMTDSGGTDALASAARAGHTHVCEWLLSNGCPWGAHAAADAAMGGRAELMSWLLARCPDPARTQDREIRGLLLAAVAFGCDLSTLVRLHHEWLDEADEFAADPAPPQPHMQPLLQYEHQQPDLHAAAGADPPQPLPTHGLSATAKTTLIAAAAGGSTPDWRGKVEWLEARGCARAAAACESAAAVAAGGAERVAWLHGRGYPLSHEAAFVAATSGNVAALQYLLSHGVRPRESAARAAAAGGQLESLVALRAAGCAIDDVALLLAAHNGHLPVVSWLAEEALGAGALQAPAAVLLFALAGNGGCLDLLAWLRERGCPWGDACFVAAAGAGWVEGLEWLAQQGCPMPTTGGAYVAAGLNADFATLRCLRRIGVPWGAWALAFTESVYSEMRGQGCGVRVLQWMLQEGCPVDWDRALAAVGQRLAGPGGGAAAAEVRDWLIVQRDARRGSGSGGAGGGGGGSGADAIEHAGGSGKPGGQGRGLRAWVRRLGSVFGGLGGVCTRLPAVQGEGPR